MERGVDHGQGGVVGHLGCHLVHIEVFGVDLLHVLDHLVGDAEERGVDHIVLPQCHLVDMTLVEQGELFEELLQAEHLSHIVEALLIIGDARLGVERVDERVGDALVLATSHKRPELFGLEYRIFTCSRLEHAVDLAQQQGLVGVVLEFMDDKVLLRLAFAVQSLFDADGTHVDEFQDTGREQVVVVGAEILISVKHVVSLLEVAFHGDVTIPEQILVHFLARAPYIYKIPDKAHDGDNEETDGHDEQDDGILSGPFVIAGIVAALESQLLLVFEGVVFLNGGLEHPFVETHHDIHGTAMAEVFRVVGNNPTILEAEFAPETESPDATVLVGKQDRVFCLNGNLGMIGLG